MSRESYGPLVYCSSFAVKAHGHSDVDGSDEKTQLRGWESEINDTSRPGRRLSERRSISI